jgi:formate dehydrogenase subunit gamma
MTETTDTAGLGIAASIAAAHKDVPGGLLPALHGIQDALGYVPPDAVPLVAEQFNLSRAEVHGVVSYYHHFRSAPAGRLLVQVCRAEACKAMGADALLAHAEQRLGCGVHGTSADGQYSLEPVFCLGLCASSPSIAINDEVHARITPALFDEIVGEVRQTS